MLLREGAMESRSQYLSLLSLYSLGLFPENVLFELMFMFSTCDWRYSG